MKLPPSGILMICIAVVGNITSASSSGEDLLPADAPVISMMERINTARVTTDTEEVLGKTSLGKIIGMREKTIPPHLPNTHYNAFRGIPFAKPPINDLRFKDPVDWDFEWQGGQLNATKFRPFCPQFNVDTKQILGEEDCLYLNVYTPSIPDTNTNNKKELLPVLVFIHGGAFTRGSSSAHGAEKLLARNLVVVTLNYRLGMLGFLSMDDSVLPGNYGMFDQLSVLRWVQRYISEFGGDPNQVTIGGFSAGGVSVNLHLLSPLSEGMFNRAIMMSGTANCAWSVQENPQIPAKLLASALSCPASPSSALASCVISKDYKELLKAQASLFRFEVFPLWIAPTIDSKSRLKPFLPAPITQLQSRPVPSLFGSVPNEALLYSTNCFAMAELDGVKTPQELYDLVVIESFQPWEDEETGPERHKILEQFYFSDSARESKDVFLEEITEAFTDNGFLTCVGETADMQASTGAPVYMYHMTHREEGSPSWATPLYQRLWKLGYTSPLLKTGVSHGDDLMHVFEFPHTIVNELSSGDQRVADILLSVVSNFVIHGKPQTDAGITSELPLWPQSVPGKGVGYYNIGIDPVMVNKPFRHKERNYWHKILPSILEMTRSSKSTGYCTKDGDEEICPTKR